MIETLTRLLEFAEMHATALLGISVFTLVVTLVALPVMILRLPSSYFLEDDRPRPLSRHLIVHWFLMALKNLFGLSLVLIGLLLVFLPGQGLLTMIIGLTVMNYPGKFHIERWLVLRPGVLKAMNWLRNRFDVTPLQDP